MAKPCLQTESRDNFLTFYHVSPPFFLSWCIFHAPRESARWEPTHNATLPAGIKRRKWLHLPDKHARRRGDHGCDEINNQKSFNRSIPEMVRLRWPIYNWHGPLLIHMCGIIYSEAFRNDSWWAMTPINTNSRLHAELWGYLKRHSHVP